MGSYGLANKLKFYVSYPLYSYANGLLKQSSDTLSNEQINSMLTLNPSKQHSIDVEAGNGFVLEDSLERESDFFMVLGHNFETHGQSLTLADENGELSGTTIINNCIGESPEYNGWSLSTIASGSDGGEKTITFNQEQPNKIGSILYGKSWAAPINVNLGQSYSVNYSSKQSKTVSGKTLSTLNYDKVSNWGNLPAWELMSDSENPFPESFGNTDYRGNQRTGIRSWSVNFSMLNDSDILNQNQMVTSNGWTQDTASNYSTGADGSSLYNNQNSGDFMTSVYKMTMGSHLPVVVNISDSKNADQWAIVRITKFSMKESNPKLIDISMTLEEQV